jgi:hypothetical protein
VGERGERKRREEGRGMKGSHLVVDLPPFSPSLNIVAAFLYDL